MSAGEFFAVEAIVAKKTMNHKTYYMVKWLDYSSSENTWEPEKNLKQCWSLVEDYERRAASLAKKPVPFSSTAVKSDPAAKSKIQVDFAEIDNKHVDPRLQVDTIIGMIPDPATNKKYFAVRWKSPAEQEVDIISSTYARENFPLKVIEFYQSKIVFTN